MAAITYPRLIYIKNVTTGGVTEDIQVCDYTLKSIAIFSTKAWGKANGGMMARSGAILNYGLTQPGGATAPGWLFAKSDPRARTILLTLFGVDIIALTLPAPKLLTSGQHAARRTPSPVSGADIVKLTNSLSAPERKPHLIHSEHNGTDVIHVYDASPTSVMILADHAWNLENEDILKHNGGLLSSYEKNGIISPAWFFSKTNKLSKKLLSLFFGRDVMSEQAAATSDAIQGDIDEKKTPELVHPSATEVLARLEAPKASLPIVTPPLAPTPSALPTALPPSAPPSSGNVCSLCTFRNADCMERCEVCHEPISSVGV